MGSCQSVPNKNNNNNNKGGTHKQPQICAVEVCKVNPVATEELENFKKEYLSDEYIHDNEPGYEERMKDTVALMYKRWDWLQSNPQTYVNMLRVKGFSDENIQDCLDGKRPLSFPSKEMHEEFCKSLGELQGKLENEMKIKICNFIQTGSSVPGYSSNPTKGFAEKPSKITNLGSSDVDIVIIAEGVVPVFDAKQKEGAIKYKKYPSTTSRDGEQSTRYGVKPNFLPALSQALTEWYSTWSGKMKSGIQITFQEKGAVIPPWELPIPVPLARTVVV